MKDKLKNNLGLKLIAIIFALLLCCIVVNIDDPIDTKQYVVNVSLTNSEVITNAGKSFQILDDTNSITVTVKARRKVLDEIKSSYILATADLREMQDSSVPIRLKIVGYEGAYEAVSAYPQNIQVRVENTQKKTFPITAVSTGSPRDGYVVGRMTISPQSVDISGPESMVNKISKVVAKVDVSEISSDTTIETELIYYDAADNRIDKSLLSSNCDKNGVTVSVDIWHTKKVNLNFDTSQIKPAEGYVFAGIEIEPQNIRVAGTNEKLNEIAHPIIMKRLHLAMEQCDDTLVFAEVPLLFEGGFENDFGEVIVITRSLAKRIESVKNRDKLSEQEIQERISQQFDYTHLDERIKNIKAYVVQNEGDELTLKNQICSIVETLK